MNFPQVPSPWSVATQCASLYNKAREAGLAAGSKTVPVPMNVAQVDPMSGAVLKVYPQIDDGVCGFAWVNVKPGNSPFANWAKKAGLARKAYEGGVQFWVGDFSQSMARKEDYAYAFAKVLNDAGVKAYANSRID